MVNGMGETTGAALVAHPDVDKIAFTGHVDTAKIIESAADTLKRTTFELGAKVRTSSLPMPTWMRPSTVPFTPFIFTAVSAARPEAGSLSSRRSITNSSTPCREG